ncbi:MAG: hypothetical protein NC548_29765 [Lachnospiraceae bacterium]|nr:hypothetical protein [Lachnospiraceae bacterium]
MRYKVKVINSPSGLEMMDQPSPSSNKKSELPNNASFIAIDTKKAFDGSVWFQDESTGYWVPYQKGGRTYVKFVTDLGIQLMAAMPANASASTTDQNILFRNSKQVVTMNLRDGVTSDNSYVPLNSAILRIGDGLKPVKQEVVQNTNLPTGNHAQKPQVNSNNYPTVVATNQINGKITYDYTMDLSDITAAMNLVKRDMNIPFGDMYTIPKLNKLMHTQFNRYRVVYPDYERQRLIPYVFFTRPDLNFFNSSLTATTESLKANRQLDFLVASNPMTAKSLTLGYTSAHVLNPLLCNRVASFDVSDDTIEVQESGETFTGYKIKYAKNTVRSMTGGSLNIKFPETYNLGITVMHQLWVGYENAVYRGLMEPKQKYVTGKILDYACDIFYFLADSQGTIWFWSQILGAFPTSVNKSVFSYDEGSLVSFPSVSVTYDYFWRKDWDPDSIIDFNIAAGMNESTAIAMNGSANQPKAMYLADYIPALGHAGRTWAATPFIESFLEDDGSGKRVQRFRIRFHPAADDVI